MSSSRGGALASLLRLISVACLVAALTTPAVAVAQPSASQVAPAATLANPSSCFPPTDTTGAPSVGTGSISGRVVDGNGNGVADIRIRAFTAANLGATTNSTPDGSFALLGIAETTHVLSYYDPDGAVQNGFLGASGLVLDRANADPIDASSDPILSDLVLPDEQLSVVSGRITDSGGDPVADVQVLAASTDFPLYACATTDLNGEYTMPDVHTGLYIVSVTDPSAVNPDGFFDAGSPGSFATNYANAGPVAVTANILGLDVQYPETFSLSGAITGAFGVEGISITACELIEGGLCARGQSAADGTFTLAPLVAGTYVIHQSDGSGTYVRGYHVTGGVDPDREDALPIEVLGDTTGILLTAVPNPRLGGTVTDASANPLEGINVSACEVSEGECPNGVTDADGEYSFGVNPGTYVIRFDHPTGAYPGGYYGPADTGTPVEFVETEAEARQITVAAADVTLQPVALPDGARISGTVLTDGIGVPGTSVDVCRSELVCVASGSTEGDGTFTTTAARAGAYLLGGFDSNGERVWYVDGGVGSTDVNVASSINLGATDVTGIVFDIPAENPAIVTPAGQNVGVLGPIDPLTGQPAVTLTFDDVTVAGETTFTPSEGSPYAPAGFQVGVPATYYEISTTATFVGLVTVCLSYSGVTFPDEASLRLYHYDLIADAWEDITVSQDLDADVICGRTDSFSPFVVGQPIAAFDGFEAPVDDLPTPNRAKAGSAIPVIFGLGGDFGFDFLMDGYPSSVPADCNTGTAPDQIESTATVRNSTLTYNQDTRLYTYVWQTKKEWANTCRLLTLKLEDGSTQSALFTFKK